ncbi:MAG: hypothetical protein EXX96DRAFT_301404 [Benjaminiella poitrasii]|nr:MAG: hypothetical protein EXX96DRAFT_301404 [Benjaminiella poitrasii]
MYTSRNRARYVLAATSNNRKNVEITGALSIESLTAHNLSFELTGSQGLLQLESFDPSLDTPVDALHCLPLGVAKYLIEHLVKVTLAGRPNEDIMTRLTRQLKHHENNRSYTRSFRKNIRHIGSFVGVNEDSKIVKKYAVSEIDIHGSLLYNETGEHLYLDSVIPLGIDM